MTTVISAIYGLAVFLFFISFVFLMGANTVPNFIEGLPPPPSPPNPPNTSGILGSLTAFGNALYFVLVNIAYFFKFLFLTSGYTWFRMIIIVPLTIEIILIIILIIRGTGLMG